MKNIMDALTLKKDEIKKLSIYLVFITATLALFNLSFTTVNKGFHKASMNIGPDTILTPDNSGLLSQKVTCILIDTFNVKWFGTDKGISRFDGTNWDTISDKNYLLNNKINKIAYERTSYGHEIWVATDGGLSVASFNVDGITSATTYTTSNTILLNDTVTTVGVDILHNRWIGTKSGINVFKGSSWDSIRTFYNADNTEMEFKSVIINGFGSYEKDSMAYISTYGGGILRYSYDAIDGFTGASTMGNPWSGLNTNDVNTICIYDTTQYVGATDGFYIHEGNHCKENWTYYSTAEGLISGFVRAVEVDDSGAIWIGTDAGLNIKKGKKWYTYEVSDGLVNSVINDIKKDKNGIIWVATDSGVQYFTSIPGRQTGGLLPIQSQNVIAMNVTSESTDLVWTNGDVGNRIAFIKAGSDGLVTPVNNTTYTADAEFGVGSEIDGWYCIYKGTGNSVTVTGLSSKTLYRVMVCEFSDNSGSEQYVTTEDIGNPANFTTLKTGVESITRDYFNIYPNPFGDQLTIKNIAGADKVDVSIYQQDSKLVLKNVFSGSEGTLNTSKLKSGTYIISIKDGQDIYSLKVIKK
jgi:hypothetical protein